MATYYVMVKDGRVFGPYNALSSTAARKQFLKKHPVFKGSRIKVRKSIH